MKSQLLAGAARVEISIPDNFFPYRSFKGRLLTGQHDPLYVRCLFLQNDNVEALLLSMDLGDLGDIEWWQEQLSGIYGVPKEYIWLTVTHNHEAPHVSDSYHQEVVDVEKTAQFGQWVWDSTRQAVEQARAALTPSRVAYGTGRCEINVNRDLKCGNHYTIGVHSHGISDKTVSVMRFDTLQGEAIAYWVNYPVHGCVMFDAKIKDGGMLVSGDLPGATSRIVEERVPGAVALWNSAAAADQNPRYLACRQVMEPDGTLRTVDAGEAGYLLLQVQAENLADEVLLVAAHMPEGEAAVDIRGIQKIYTVPGQEKLEGPMSQATSDYQYRNGPPVRMHLSVLSLNDNALVGIPGEIVCSIGLQLKDALLSKYENVIVVTHCNGSISYMSDDRGFANRTFEAVRSHVRRGCAQKAIIDGAMELAETLEKT